MASDPLELEHLIGFCAVQFHPRDPNVLISHIGCLVIIGKADDAHQQEFLRGHTEEITCLAVSPSGNLIASGQVSSTRVPNSEAQVMVWDYSSRQLVYSLSQLHDGVAFSRNRVRNLAFSPDDRFLAGSDDQPGAAKLCVWDMETGSLENISKQKELSFLTWGDVVASGSKMNRNASYRLYGGAGDKVLRFSVDFDVGMMKYKLSGEVFKMPASGLARSYAAGAMHAGNNFLVTGSSAGELAVFNVDTMVFRACVPVSCGGLTALVSKELAPGDGVVYCGCGDGKVKVLRGQDQAWRVESECQFAGAILGMSLSADARELLVATADGDVFRLDPMTLAPADAEGSGRPFMASHTEPLNCVAFGDSSEFFAAGADLGQLRVWELSHYSIKTAIAPSYFKKGAKGALPHVSAVLFSSVQGAGPKTLLSGWADGFIRCHTVEGKPLWEITSAHRDGVSALTASDGLTCSRSFVASGGADGVLRLWCTSTRTLLAQFPEHRGAVTGLLLDDAKPHLLHSCSVDKSVVTVDLKSERRVAAHKVKEGAFHAMAQTPLNEHELLTCDTCGSVKFWDIDEAEARSMLVTWTERDEEAEKEKRLNHISLSPPAGDHPGGRFLVASTAAGELQVWDLDQKPSEPISVGLAHSHEISQARFSPDGRQIVSAGKDCCIAVWNFYGA